MPCVSNSNAWDAVPIGKVFHFDTQTVQHGYHRLQSPTPCAASGTLMHGTQFRWSAIADGTSPCPLPRLWLIAVCASSLHESIAPVNCAGGGGGIRTHGPCGRRFSRPLLSTAQPPLRETRHDRRVSSERACRRALHVLLGEVFHLVEEGIRRLEVPVDGGKANVGHLVELLQARENHLADAR